MDKTLLGPWLRQTSIKVLALAVLGALVPLASRLVLAKAATENDVLLGILQVIAAALCPPLMLLDINGPEVRDSGSALASVALINAVLYGSVTAVLAAMGRWAPRVRWLKVFALGLWLFLTVIRSIGAF